MVVRFSLKLTYEMNNGWIKIHRKSLESSVWQNPTVWWVWSWCLMKASHQKHKFPFNNQDIEVDEGEFITGITKACEELKLTSQKYRTAIKYLQNTKRITIKTTNRFSLIKVNKWQEYQVDNKPTNKPITNKQQTNNKPITTYNKGKNEKNVKNREHTQITKDFFNNKNFNPYKEKFNDKYTSDVVDVEFQKFWMYWTEPLKSGKERWTDQKAFEITRRLLTWFGRIREQRNYKEKPIAKIR